MITIGLEMINMIFIDVLGARKNCKSDILPFTLR